MLDLQGRSKGFGFVCFDSQESSVRAMTEMNSKIIEGKPLYVALAQRKEIRRVTLAKERQKDVSQPTHVNNQIGSNSTERIQISYDQKQEDYKGSFAKQEQFPQPIVITQQATQLQGEWDAKTSSATTNPQYNSITSLDYSSEQQDKMNQIPTNNLQDQISTNPSQLSDSNLFLQSGLNSEKISRNDLDEPLTSELLNSLNASQQKQIIGERIFPLIQIREPTLSGKITGMLLEMDNMELLHLLEDEESLIEKVNEAIVVLNQHVEVNSLV